MTATRSKRAGERERRWNRTPSSGKLTWKPDTQADGPAMEMVVDTFVELVGFRCRQRKRNVELDIDQHPLLALLLEVVHADVDPYLVVAQKEAPAVHQTRVAQQALHISLLSWP